MARKKNIKDVDDADLELINSKMGYSITDRLQNVTQIKSYDYKVTIKCKNKKQKDFLNKLSWINNISEILGSSKFCK